MDQLGESIRKLILAGIGAVAMTKEKSADVLKDLVKKGELTVDQGRVLNEELKHNLKEKIRDNVTVNVSSAPENLMDAVDGMDDAQLAALKARIQAAEAARTQPAGELAAEEAPAEEPTDEEVSE